MNSTIAGRDGSAAGDPRIEYRLCRCSAGREFLDRLGRQRLAAYAPLSVPSPIFLGAGLRTICPSKTTPSVSTIWKHFAVRA